ncbi:MAG: hypothetical protein UZ03_NOB001002763 [Nitrospira sp. OLB3]|nr:MAG: hypothetical protein UZ03_NOB001002763 [Nitrospira sp. OLB3]
MNYWQAPVRDTQIGLSTPLNLWRSGSFLVTGVVVWPMMFQDI